MIYKFRRREARPFLTLGELVQDKHPELWQALQYHIAPDSDPVLRNHGPVEFYIIEIEPSNELRRLMEERPKPGRPGMGPVSVSVFVNEQNKQKPLPNNPKTVKKAQKRLKRKIRILMRTD